jgi:hypothetical protein
MTAKPGRLVRFEFSYWFSDEEFGHLDDDELIQHAEDKLDNDEHLTPDYSEVESMMAD